MKQTDEPNKTRLPVTAEVGSEGGSYAEPTQQVAHQEGDVGRTAGGSEPDTVESGVDDVTKYPSEAPE